MCMKCFLSFPLLPPPSGAAFLLLLTYSDLKADVKESSIKYVLITRTNLNYMQKHSDYARANLRIFYILILLKWEYCFKIIPKDCKHRS